ncbi:MAG: family oxidoreductase [Rhodospirillales bacterium]|nr:family oxidoreductase [Rhodospirillales bacterium]
MIGKTVVITGATSGIGLEVAEDLARQGAALVLVGRDRQRGEAALARLRAAAPHASVDIRYADLSEMAEVRRLAADLLATVGRIDVLINNAGAIFDRHALTSDGLERTFALNHMAYFLLTELLLERLKQAPAARIVNVASEAHRGATLDFSDLTGRNGAKGRLAYSRSKLANILFTSELAQRLAGTSVTANCLHPGFVASRFGEPGNGWAMRLGIGLLKRLIAITPEEGAKTIVFLAASPEVGATTGGSEVAAVSGRYYAKCRAIEPSAAARDAATARRLWDESARIAGLTTDGGDRGMAAPAAAG